MKREDEKVRRRVRPAARAGQTRRTARVIESAARSDPPPLTEQEQDFNHYLEELAREREDTRGRTGAPDDT